MKCSSCGREVTEQTIAMWIRHDRAMCTCSHVLHIDKRQFEKESENVIQDKRCEKV